MATRGQAHRLTPRKLLKRLRSAQPTMRQLMAWQAKGGCEATDGCWVEPDGHCEHGCPSWMLALGLI
ncbi:MAG TPA: hypothetical protein VMY98_04365 [Anaerolineae bacterium]|nr:hypothetical protein [Anaerolineae bacterium]